MDATASFHFTLQRDQIFLLAVASGAFTASYLIIKNFSLVPPQLAYTALGAITIVAITAIRSQQQPPRTHDTNLFIDDFIVHREHPANRRRNNLPLQHQPARRNLNHRRNNNNIINPNNANIVD